MRRKRRYEEKVNHDRWLVSYADFITLLFAFFVVMYSISSVNEGKYRVLSNTLVGAFKPKTEKINPIQVGDVATSLKSSEPGPYNQENSQAAVIAPLIEAPALEEVNQDAPEVQTATEKNERDLSTLATDIQEVMSDYIDQDLVEVTQTKHWIEVEIKSQMLFGSGTARISYKALKVIRSIAAILKPLPNAVNVEGHTDNIPIKNAMFPSNWELSASRAASVVHIFSRLGIDPDRLAAIGYAEHRPVADNATAEGRQKNRRVSLLIMTDKKQKAGRRAVMPAEAKL